MRCREEGFAFKKQWESFQGQRECFQNDGHKLKRKGAARLYMLCAKFMLKVLHLRSSGNHFRDKGSVSGMISVC